MRKGSRFLNAKEVGQAIRLDSELRFKIRIVEIKTSLSRADSEPVLGQPIGGGMRTNSWTNRSG